VRLGGWRRLANDVATATRTESIQAWLTFDQLTTARQAKTWTTPLDAVGVLLAIPLTNGTTAKIINAPESAGSLSTLAARTLDRFAAGEAERRNPPKDPAMLQHGAPNVAGVLVTGNADDLAEVVRHQPCHIYSATRGVASTMPPIAPRFEPRTRP
jgi:hypothetical protein